MDIEDDDFWTPLDPVKKGNNRPKVKPTKQKKTNHYNFCRDDDSEPMDVLDGEADEWLYKLFKPTPEWTRFQPPWVKKERKKK